ncbi:hypothetical protein ARMSODRAFT_1035540 [Armillaria solidipes]|uniref:Uncharacterized protein n=1 Tax=Armillaria solidipes TaxID=1076256 RepID=A0A2H3ALA2_9AGAR|nr:hypothetical protein ARMSODRAFT_1035540 [Armillaria solidipes]
MSTSNHEHQATSSEEFELYVSALSFPPQSASNVQRSNNLSPAVLDAQPASPTTALTRDPDTSNDQQQGNRSSEQTEPYVSAFPSPPRSSSNVRRSDTLSPTVLDAQTASTTTALTQDPEPSNPQQVTFARLGSRVTVVGYIDGEGTLLRVEVVLSRGNLSVSVGYDFGEHVSFVLELTVLENGDVRIVGGDIHLSFGAAFRAQYHFVR